MCFKERFVLVLYLTYFFKKIKNNHQIILFISEIILFILGYLIVFIFPLIANNYHSCWDNFSILLFLLKNKNLLYYFFINIFIFTFSFYFLFTDSKKRNYYMCLISLYSIIFDFISSFLYCNYIGIFEKLFKKSYSKIISKIISDYATILLILVIYSVFFWFLYYMMAKTWKIEYDKIEFNFIFLQSILKSGVSFITIISIFNMKLSGLFLLLALYFESYAAFIYPFIEMGKYLREEELKQIIKK